MQSPLEERALKRPPLPLPDPRPNHQRPVALDAPVPNAAVPSPALAERAAAPAAPARTAAPLAVRLAPRPLLRIALLRLLERRRVPRRVPRPLRSRLRGEHERFLLRKMSAS